MWIGANVAVLPHVHIGDGAVLGAIVAGVPAKHIGYRFSKKVRDSLLRIKWWDWDDDVIKEREQDLYYVEKFIDKYGK